LQQQTIRQLADRGHVKAIRTDAGVRLYDADDIRKLKAERNERQNRK